MTLCSITICGRVGKDPETKETQNGKTKTTFSLAVTRKRGQEDQTTWFWCEAWEQQGKVVQQYVKKGDLMTISGVMVNEKYQEKDFWKVIVSQVSLPAKANGSGSSNTGSSKAGSTGSKSTEDDCPW